MEIVTGYSFRPDDLRVAERAPGISGFMRIRNGEDFLEASIRTHIHAFDEVVAVYNQCTDATPDILARLAQEYGPKLRLFHYADRVYPAGSAEHAAEPADSPHSLVNYYNFALSRTRFTHATKLDDDHLAIAPGLERLVNGVRSGAFGREMSCFSGFNLARDADGSTGIMVLHPFSGGGDIGIFPVMPETFFTHDRRFERFNADGLSRRFRGFVYWHLKFMKPDLGFGNYELSSQPDGRYARKLSRITAGSQVVPFGDLGSLVGPADRLLMGARRLGLPLPEKLALKADRWMGALAVKADVPAIRPHGSEAEAPQQLGDGGG